MPIRELDTELPKYAMPRKGIALNKNITELSPEECIQTQNMIWRNGIVTRGGMGLFESTELSAGYALQTLVQFSVGIYGPFLVGMANKVVGYTEGAGWTTLYTQANNYPTQMVAWPALGRLYICNHLDKMRYWAGTGAATEITIADGTPRCCLPYQDRLLTIINGDLTWSASFDDTGANWQTKAQCGVRPDYLMGMGYQSVTGSSAGYEAKVLLAGLRGMYLFAATDLRTPSTTGDYTIYDLGIGVGCTRTETIVWTPKGTIWFGEDNQVYLLPFGSLSPIAIGHKIRSRTNLVKGLESAIDGVGCAVYHDGFYKLSAAINSSYVDTQFWLDINRMYVDEDGFVGPWYGPMTGQAINSFCYEKEITNINNDFLLLYGGDRTKSYVYILESGYADITPATGANIAIQGIWQTYYHPFQNSALKKNIQRGEIEALGTSTATLDFYDINQVALTSSISAALGSSALPTRVSFNFNPVIQARRLQAKVTVSSATAKNEIYSLTVDAKEQGQIFG